MTEQPIKGNKALRVFLEPILCRTISNEDIWRLKVKYSIPCKRINKRVLEYNPEAVIKVLVKEIVKSRYLVV